MSAIGKLFTDTGATGKIAFNIFLVLIILFVAHNFLSEFGLKLYKMYYGIEGLAGGSEDASALGLKVYEKKSPGTGVDKTKKIDLSAYGQTDGSHCMNIKNLEQAAQIARASGAKSFFRYLPGSAGEHDGSFRTCFSLLDVQDLPVASMPTIDPNSTYQGNTYAVLDEPAGAAGGTTPSIEVSWPDKATMTSCDDFTSTVGPYRSAAGGWLVPDCNIGLTQGTAGCPAIKHNVGEPNEQSTTGWGRTACDYGAKLKAVGGTAPVAAPVAPAVAPLDTIEVTSGKGGKQVNSAMLTEDECKKYTSDHNYHFNYNNTNPQGCIKTGNQVRWAPTGDPRYSCSTSNVCIEKPKPATAPAAPIDTCATTDLAKIKWCKDAGPWGSDFGCCVQSNKNPCPPGRDAGTLDGYPKCSSKVTDRRPGAGSAKDICAQINWNASDISTTCNSARKDAAGQTLAQACSTQCGPYLSSGAAAGAGAGAEENSICDGVNWKADNISAMCNNNKPGWITGPYANKTLAEVCPTACSVYQGDTAIQVAEDGKVQADETAKEYAATTSQQHEADQKKYATDYATAPGGAVGSTDETGTASGSVAKDAASSLATQAISGVGPLASNATVANMGVYPSQTNLDNIQGGNASLGSMAGALTSMEPSLLAPKTSESASKANKEISRQIQDATDATDATTIDMTFHMKIPDHLAGSVINSIPQYTNPQQYASGRTTGLSNVNGYNDTQYNSMPVQSLGTTYQNRLGGNYPSYQYNTQNNAGSAYTNQYHPTNPNKTPSAYNSLMDLFR